MNIMNILISTHKLQKRTLQKRTSEKNFRKISYEKWKKKNEINFHSSQDVIPIISDSSLSERENFQSADDEILFANANGLR